MSLSDRSGGSDVPILPGERADDLQLGGLKILQKDGTFRFGTDAVLLSDFVLLKRRGRVVDFGAGTGIIALLLAAHHPDIRVDAVEIQPDMADMALRSVKMNALEDRVTVHAADLRRIPAILGHGTANAVVCNPPYSRPDAALLPENENKRLSRVESGITIQEICRAAFLVLKTGGRLSVVFPAQRMFEMMTAMQNERLAPKRVRMVYATARHAPRLVLMDAVKQGGAQLDCLAPLILSEENGEPSAEWKRIYAPR